jgi:tRNA dimethylallyltransferase
VKHRLCCALVGPTASGKTKLAIAIAKHLEGEIDCEIVCMDSTTVYRGFDIGSSKPTAEERAAVPHHLLDLLKPDEPFSAGHFVQLANETITDIQNRGKLPLVVGGTYFYLRALQHGMYAVPPIQAEVIETIEKEFFDDEVLNTGRMHEELVAKDPAAAQTIHRNDRYRLVRALAILRTTGELPSRLQPVPVSEEAEKRLWMKYAIAVSRNALQENIAKRTDAMIAAGLVEETRKIESEYPQSRALGSIGYAEARLFLARKLTEKQLRLEIIEKTRQLAKRQMTWLRSDPELRFVDHRDGDRIRKEVENLRAALGN